jgi:protein-S-isoprenylcysteine O-methyltransferase Ste14
MIALYVWLIGIVIFILGAGYFGVWLRRNPSKENAEKSSRVVQFLFFSGLGTPFIVSLFIPGLNNLDGLVGFASLPGYPLFLILGFALAAPGLFLMGSSLRLLRALGSGANAFKLTKRVVAGDIYQSTRNPMSLGYYLTGMGIGFISGSTLLTMIVLFGIIPAHLFCLKYFEERELELRFGDAYNTYKQDVPFLFPRFTNKS